MSLTQKDIEHIARLARLSLTKKESAMYAEQLSTVLDFVRMLNGVNTDDVPETTQVTGLEDIFREDEILACDGEMRKKIIERFPEERRGMLKVKEVFEKNGET